MTCGQGASCAGQCSALGASLCPSGECTDDPRTCDLEFRSKNEEDSQSGGSTATYSGSDLGWCTNAQHQCRVRTFKDCCYNPNCLKWKGRKEACAWLNYLTGIEQQTHEKINVNISGKTCPFPGSLPHGNWTCEMQEIPIQGTSFLDEDAQSYPGDY